MDRWKTSFFIDTVKVRIKAMIAVKKKKLQKLFL